jgi:hypothetical protein
MRERIKSKAKISGSGATVLEKLLRHEFFGELLAA